MSRLAALGLTATLSLGALGALGACKTTHIIEEVDPSLADAGNGGEGGAAAETTTVDGPSKKLFGIATRSFAKVDAEGTVVSVGVVIPHEALAAGPADHPFQDDVVLEMPDVAKEQTLIHHLRANWLAAGHGPDPYGEPHWDLHFLRGSVDDIDKIDCRSDMRMPSADKLPEGYGTPELCVKAMGYHSWPEADLAGGAFTGSIIMGYWSGNVVFIEPMIPQKTFDKKKTFEIPIAKPASAGGATTLYPTRMLATWDEETASYTFEFDKLESID